MCKKLMTLTLALFLIFGFMSPAFATEPETDEVMAQEEVDEVAEETGEPVLVETTEPETNEPVAETDEPVAETDEPEAVEEEEEEELDPADYPRFNASSFNKVVLLNGSRYDNVNFADITFYMVDDIGPYESNKSYIRLKDMAALLAGTDAAFNVVGEGSDVTITTGTDYVKEANDLVKREAPLTIEVLEDYTAMINGEAVALDAVLLDGELYVQVGSLRTGLGRIYHGTLSGDEYELYAFENNIPKITASELSEVIKGDDYTVVFLWATWCPWSQREFSEGNVGEFMEYAKTHNVKVVNLMGDYDNLNLQYLQNMTGYEVSDAWHVYAFEGEAREYFESDILKFEHALWYPTVIIVDANGERVIEYDNGEDYSWVDLIKLHMEGRIDEVLAAREDTEETEEPVVETEEPVVETEEAVATDEAPEKETDDTKAPEKKPVEKGKLPRTGAALSLTGLAGLVTLAGGVYLTRKK